ncbi:MAG: restriction endonuclease subunit S [Planctomycetes bacterium]|nr:restriction endonuclease subunit S [Planctomycetota bacterium]
MKKGWQTKKLGDVCEVFADGDWVESKDQSSEGIRLIQTGNVGEGVFKDRAEKARYISEATFKRLRCTEIVEGDCLVSRLPDPVGRSCILPDTGERMITAVDCTILRFNPTQLLPMFFNLYSQSDDYLTTVAKECTGTTRNRISRTNLGLTPIPVPPLAEQQRIVGLLDEAFEGLATAKANAEKNLQNARALFESGLDSAITGKLTLEWRRKHTKTGSASADLAARLAVRRKQWMGTGKYREPDAPVTLKPIDIPDGWVLASPEQITTHIVDCPHSTPKWAETGVVCLRTTNFKPGLLDLESVRFVSQQTYKERIMRLEPQAGDVLYSREGGILGIACMIPEKLKACLGQRMMLFRTDAALVLPEYFTAVLNSTLILSEVKRLTGGAASPHLNICDIRTFPIPLPPITEQRQIVAKLNTIAAETQRLTQIYERKLAALEALKKSLLHQAFTGEL